MALSATEQYLLELINRARLDPAAEAERYGRDLNAGLNAGTITTDAKQVLAANVLLEQAAIKHSQWMLETDTFSHTGENGSTWYGRMQAEGYYGSGYRENLAWAGSTGSIDALRMIEKHHEGLYLSAGHRKNLFAGASREIGIAQELGEFTSTNDSNVTRTYNASMLTEKFANRGEDYFVTGVAYRDTDGDDFYTVGEGQGGLAFHADSDSTQSAGSGGYALKVVQSTKTKVSVREGGVEIARMRVDTTDGNAKVDVVEDANGGFSLRLSADTRLDWGINDGVLLGSADLKIWGNGKHNTLDGNRGDNYLSGGRGNDTLRGHDGRDRLNAGDGDDRLEGGAGDDLLQGRKGHDVLLGGAGIDVLVADLGDDTLDGGAGKDRMYGGGGADTFIFNASVDVICDFENDIDTVVLDREALGLGADTTVEDVLALAKLRGDDIMFDFGDGNRLWLRDYTDIGSVADDLILA